MFLTAAVLSDRGAARQSPPEAAGTINAAAVVSSTGDLSGTIAALQQRLRRLPADSGAWATLGLAYVQQARITGDPSYYTKAAGVLRRSLQEEPEDNVPALTGQAALAAARHDFAASLRFARRAQRSSTFDSVSLGIMVDALVELGRYRQANRAVQRMVRLKPSVPSYSRVSYVFELQGNLRGARYAMQQALAAAYSPDDKAFTLFQLAELAWNAGDLDRAEHLYAKGLRIDRSFVPLLAGRSRVEVARGNTRRALRDYRTVTARLPQLSYVIEYADLLVSLGRERAAERQFAVVDAQKTLLRAAGVNVDLDLVLYDADHGRARQAVRAAAAVWDDRRSVYVEDAYAWALHVNGRDRKALEHARAAAAQGTRSALFAFHRGMIERSLGMTAAATRSLKRALAINPYFSPRHSPTAHRVLASLTSTR
jgi:tetratricopeptide (TPR) repeat protein